MAEALARPRGLGPCDLLTADELAAYLHCRPADAQDWADVHGLRLRGPGRAALYLVGDIDQALRDDRDRAKKPKPTPIPPAPLVLAEVAPYAGGPRRGKVR